MLLALLSWTTVLGASILFQTTQTEATATHIAVYVFSPLVLAVLRRRNWGSDFMAIAAFLTVTLLYTAGAWIDQRLAWPITGAFWSGLLAAYGTQQASYNILEIAGVLPRVEQETY